MKNSVCPSGRRRFSAAERARWVARFQQSGLAQRQFALRHGLGLSTLQRWVAQEPVNARPDFTEVKLPALGTGWVAEVQRANGTVVRLASQVPAPLLQQLLTVC